MPSPSPSPSSSRRVRRRLEVSHKILDAGKALFEERGYDETTVAQVCEHADVAYGTFFNHFPSKADLLTALANHSVTEVAAQLESLAKRRGTIEDLLIELFAAGAEHVERLTPRQRELLARIHSLAFTESPVDRDRRFHAAFTAFLRTGVEDGRVRDDVAVETLADVLSITYASISMSWVHVQDTPIRERAAASARFLGSSLAPRRPLTAPTSGS